MQKMRLVSEALYNKLQNLEQEDPVQNKIQQKKDVLASKSIPDEAKPGLYHDLVREITAALRSAENKPIPVSDTGEIEQKKIDEQDEKVKQERFKAWLLGNKATWGTWGFRIDGQLFKSGNIKNITDRALGRVKTGNLPSGYAAVIKKLSDAGLPLDYFEIRQKGAGLRKKMTVAEVRKRMSRMAAVGKCLPRRKNNSNNMKITWKPY